MRRACIIALLLSLSVFTGIGKEKKLKPWTDWSEKDARQILNDSPWGQTQVESDISEMFFSPTTSRDTSRVAKGAVNQSVPLNLRIRLLSAKPIRQAFARSIELQQKTPSKQLSDSLAAFVARQFDDYIVVAVDFECSDQRFSNAAMQVFNGMTGDALKNNTYLETRNGKRIFLMDYKAPINDGMGAKYIFPRKVEGEPFVASESGELRFYSEMSKTMILNMRFKVADFMYDGVLEF